MQGLLAASVVPERRWTVLPRARGLVRVGVRARDLGSGHEDLPGQAAQGRASGRQCAAGMSRRVASVGEA